MPGTRGHDEPLSIDNAKEFLDSYMASRGIRMNATSKVLEECRRRAESAREGYKKLEPAGIKKPTTRAEKYARRLYNNRKSAAATRVFNEVEDAEQKHMIIETKAQLAREKVKAARARKMFEAMRAEVARMMGTTGDVATAPEGGLPPHDHMEYTPDAAFAATDAVLPTVAPIEPSALILPVGATTAPLPLPSLASLELPDSCDIDGEMDAPNDVPVHTAVEAAPSSQEVRLGDLVPFYSTSCSEDDGIFAIGGGIDRYSTPCFGC